MVPTASTEGSVTVCPDLIIRHGVSSYNVMNATGRGSGRVASLRGCRKCWRSVYEEQWHKIVEMREHDPLSLPRLDFDRDSSAVPDKVDGTLKESHPADESNSVKNGATEHDQEDRRAIRASQTTVDVCSDEKSSAADLEHPKSRGKGSRRERTTTCFHTSDSDIEVENLAPPMLLSIKPYESVFSSPSARSAQPPTPSVGVRRRKEMELAYVMNTADPQESIQEQPAGPQSPKMVPESAKNNMEGVFAESMKAMQPRSIPQTPSEAPTSATLEVEATFTQAMNESQILSAPQITSEGPESAMDETDFDVNVMKGLQTPRPTLEKKSPATASHAAEFVESAFESLKKSVKGLKGSTKASPAIDETGEQEIVSAIKDGSYQHAVSWIFAETVPAVSSDKIYLAPKQNKAVGDVVKPNLRKRPRLIEDATYVEADLLRGNVKRLRKEKVALTNRIASLLDENVTLLEGGISAARREAALLQRVAELESQLNTS